METQTISRLLIQMALFSLASGGLVSIFFGRKTNSRLTSAFLLAGSSFLLSGCLLSFPGGFTFGPLPIYVAGLVPLQLRADALSLFFLAILSFVGIAVALYSPAYLEHMKEHFNSGIYWFALFVFLGGMVQVFLSVDALTFIVFWELMSLSSAVLIVSDYASHRAKKAALIYLGATRVSTTLIFSGFVWLHFLSRSWNFADWNTIGQPSLIPLGLVFIGLCIKAGTWPFHLWLPYAHGEAPAPISALMSGVMVKVAVYAMIRLLLPGGSTPELAYCTITLGAISAFWGILFAQVETDLKRLLAYSTIENVGLIVLAIGLVMLGKSTGMETVASIALAGCLFHVLNHGVYKPLLFLAAGAVDWGAHSRDLGKLGGLQRKMPWTAALFFIGSVAICALPPLNGFASKWLIYQGLFDLCVSSASVFDRAIGIALIGLLSMIGALTVATFTKAFGLCFLGPVRTSHSENAREMPVSACAAQSLLTVACLILSLISTFVIQWLAPASSLVLARYNVPLILPQPQMVVALAVLLPVFYFVLIDFGRRKIKHFSTWECGYGMLPARSQIEPRSFSQSISSLFGLVIQFRPVRNINGRDRRHFPDEINVIAKQTLLVEQWIYTPILKAFDHAGHALIRLQTGSIHIHLLYVFTTLIVLVLVGTLR